MILLQARTIKNEWQKVKVTSLHKRQKLSEISRASKENWNQRMISINEKKAN